MYFRQRCSNGSVNKTILKPCLVYVGFSRRKISHSSAHMISEKAIRFRHPDYNLDRAQKLISSSVSRHLSTRNISSKSMHVFLSNLANRQTNTAKTFTFSFVRGNNGKYLWQCWRCCYRDKSRDETTPYLCGGVRCMTSSRSAGHSHEITWHTSMYGNFMQLQKGD